MNIKYTEQEKFETVEILGKTVETVTGTIARKTVTGRTLITEQAGFYAVDTSVGSTTVTPKVVAHGKQDEVITTVEKVPAAKIHAELAKPYGATAAVTGLEYTLFDVHTGADKDNHDVVDVYVKHQSAAHTEAAKLIGNAIGLAEANAASAGQWKLVDDQGRRVFIRIYKDVDDKGKVKDLIDAELGL